ncbi:MAG: hypothetical protein J7L44_04125 [Candidatus Diapherotrites archaeon]|nr:hypothetical protein [Candidatus Diapherotrites archaeon]
MNERAGVYTTIMAVLVLATIAMVAYTGVATVSEEHTMSYSNIILETKRVWQNARFVLDKAAGEALADFVKDRNILTGVCSDDVSGNDAQAKVEEYLTADLDEMTDPDKGEIGCTFSDFTYAPAGNIATITIKLQCEYLLKRGAGTGFYVNYAKYVTYKKEVTVSGPTCTVTVRDLQSNETDVVLS